MLNDWSTNSDSHLNKMIFLEKDDRKDADGNTIKWNKKFKKYYDSFTWLMKIDANFKKEEYMTDAFAWAWISALHMHQLSKQVLGFWQWSQLTNQKIHSYVWPEIEKEFSAISKRTYDKNPELNKKIQLKIIKHNLRWLLGWFLTNVSSLNLLKIYNSPTWPFAKLNKWWIYMQEFSTKEISDSMLQSNSSKAWEDLLDQFSESLLNYEKDWKDWTINLKEWSSITELMNNVSDDVNEKVENTE
jgi:hypothetical protein